MNQFKMSKIRLTCDPLFLVPLLLPLTEISPIPIDCVSGRKINDVSRMYLMRHYFWITICKVTQMKKRSYFYDVLRFHNSSQVPSKGRDN